MSLYYEAADFLTAPANAGGSLKSRVFSKKDLKSQPAQIYALVIETCKWSFLLKDVVERAALLNLERKLTPVLSLLLVHDLLLTKRGIMLPAAHGLRTSIERHKARLQAELTRVRIGRKLGSMDALRKYVDSGEEGSAKSEPSHPRWIRINTLKTQLEDQLETTFSEYERAAIIDAVRERGAPRIIYIDEHIPNLVAIPASIDLTKSEAYTTGAIVFQDKASCFSAYMLDPLPEDGDILDTCAAPGNKTSHLAAILSSRAHDLEDGVQKIHAFEMNKARAEILKKMMLLAECQDFTEIHAGQDFLRVDPNAPAWKNVGALLLDPSCSGSGIVGRDDMPELHLPSTDPNTAQTTKPGRREKPPKKATFKRKQSERREGGGGGGVVAAEETLSIIDDGGIVTPVHTPGDLQARLSALSAFQFSLLLHAFSFPSAYKITYSTCSIHAAENEDVVVKALASETAKKRGWRLLRRNEQVRGLREWPLRGLKEACGGADDVADACVRANKGDRHGTMGFFLAGFVRARRGDGGDDVLRDKKGFIVRDLMGFPVRAPQVFGGGGAKVGNEDINGEAEVVTEEWNGFGDNDKGIPNQSPQTPKTESRIPPAIPNDVETSIEKRTPAKKRRRRAGKS